MATDNEKLKSVIGVPDPKADPDNATLRAIAGVASFGDGDTPASGQVLHSAAQPAALAAAFASSSPLPIL